MPEPADFPEISSAADVARLDDDALRKNLESLAVARQVDLFMALGWDERLRMVRNSDKAPDVVKALPEEEVLLTIKGVGMEDSLSLIALTTPSQIRFILDVELWRRDMIDDQKVIDWVKYLLFCGEAKVIELANVCDPELMTIILSKLVRPIPKEEGIRAAEELPGIMSDDFFTILSKVPGEAQSIRLFLRILRQWDRTRFYGLLFAAYSGVGPEVEEAAFRWRSSRLGEKGVLDLDEAIEIYGYIGEDEAKALATRDHYQLPVESSGERSPAYPVLLTEGRTFFHQVLSSIQDRSLQNRLRSEIAFASNRLLVADAEEIGEIDSIKRALGRLFSLVNVGLLSLAGAGTEEAVSLLRRVPVKEIFQVGFSRVSDLRSEARDIAKRWWPEWRDQGFVFLCSPDDEMLRGLMMRVPQYCALAKGGDIDFRDFETMGEVYATRKDLFRIAVVAEACFDRVGIPTAHRARPMFEGVFAQGVEEISLESLLLTGSVNFILNGDFDINPLSKEAVKRLFEQLLETDASGEWRLKRQKIGEFLVWLKKTTSFDGLEWETLETFFMDGVRALETEIGRVVSWQDLDPRYVSKLIFGRWDKRKRKVM
jgi:hypothetical protein